MLEALPLDVEISEHPFGGAAIDAFGDPLPRRDARGLPRAPTRCCSARSAARSGTAARVRPEAGLIGLRKELDVYANLRPAVGDGQSTC